MCYRFQLGLYSMDVPPRHSPPLLALSAPRFALEGEGVQAVVAVRPQADGISGARLVVKVSIEAWGVCWLGWFKGGE